MELIDLVTMTINVNNQEMNVSENSSLVTLLDTLKISKKGIAVAINNIVITKSQWDQTLLSDLDQITVIQATQGG